MINLFDTSIINCSTLKQEVRHHLQLIMILSVISEGECKRDTFINECNGDHNRFEKAITKSKIVNFATESFVKKNKSKKTNEIAQLNGTRDLFAHLLYLAIAEKGFSEEMVVTFPLTHEPAEFVHPDGTIRTTTKSSITDLFDLVKIGPTKVDTVIVDGMFLLRNLTVPLPHTQRFGTTYIDKSPEDFRTES